jgi:hypothetical protein
MAERAPSLCAFCATVGFHAESTKGFCFGDQEVGGSNPLPDQQQLSPDFRNLPAYALDTV